MMLRTPGVSASPTCGRGHMALRSTSMTLRPSCCRRSAAQRSANAGRAGPDHERVERAVAIAHQAWSALPVDAAN
jgi:hypothetical protein